MDQNALDVQVDPPGSEEESPVDPYEEQLDPGKEVHQGEGATIDSIEADNVTIASVKELSRVENQIFAIFDQQASPWRESFQRTPVERSFFDSYTWEQVGDQARKIIFDREEVQLLTSRLRAERILMVEGPSDIGKGALIIVVASVLLRERGPERTLISREAPTLHQRIDLSKLAGDEADFRRAVVVVRDAFHRKNESLVRFVRQEGSLALMRLRDILEKHSSFLILAWDSDHRPALHPDLTQSIQTVRGPRREQIAGFLRERSLTKLEARAPGKEKTEIKRRLDDLLEQKGEAVVERLQVIGRVVRFINHHMLEVLDAEDRLAALDQALSRVEQHDLWLLEDVGKDPETLACALALAVSHAGPAGFPVRWHVFHKLRLEILHVLRAALGLEEPRSPEALCGEPELLRRMDAEVLEIDGDGPVVRWREEKRAELLWRSLLGVGRSLLALLVPRLTELCTEKDFAVRRHAAWALARIGQLDPQGIPLWLIGRWLRESEGLESHAALGALLQGAVLQGDAHLERACLQRLRGALRSSGYGKERIAAVKACGEVGVFDRSWALDELRRVARSELKARLRRLRDLEQGLRNIEITARRLTGSHEAQSKLERRFDQELKKALAQLYPPDGGAFELFAACQYVLVGLAFCHGPLALFQELDAWMPEGRENEELAPLLALMFFRVGGVLDILERYPISRDASDVTVSRIVLSASESEDGGRKLASTWFKLYLGTRWFPAGIAQGLAFRLWWWLGETSREEAEGDFRVFLLDHWRHLLRLPNAELRHQLGDLLDSLTLETHRSVRSLAADVRCSGGTE